MWKRDAYLPWSQFTRMKYTLHIVGAHSDACNQMHRTETGLLHYLFTLMLTTKFIVLKSEIAHILVQYAAFYEETKNAPELMQQHTKPMHSLMKLHCLLFIVAVASLDVYGNKRII